MKRPIISRNEVGPTPYFTAKLRMTRCLVWGVASVLCFAGDLVGKIMSYFVMAELFPLYNYLITKSYELSENYDLDIWKLKGPQDND